MKNSQSTSNPITQSALQDNLTTSWPHSGWYRNGAIHHTCRPSLSGRVPASRLLNATMARMLGGLCVYARANCDLCVCDCTSLLGPERRCLRPLRRYAHGIRIPHACVWRRALKEFERVVRGVCAVSGRQLAGSRSRHSMCALVLAAGVVAGPAPCGCRRLAVAFLPPVQLCTLLPIGLQRTPHVLFVFTLTHIPHTD
jgi:hypothetical protein